MIYILLTCKYDSMNVIWITKVNTCIYLSNIKRFIFVYKICMRSKVTRQTDRQTDIQSLFLCELEIKIINYLILMLQHKAKSESKTDLSSILRTYKLRTVFFIFFSPYIHFRVFFLNYRLAFLTKTHVLPSRSTVQFLLSLHHLSELSCWPRESRHFS